MSNAVGKVNNWVKYLSYKYVEREEIIKSLYLSMVARQHCLLVGPPGTGKSALVMDVSEVSKKLNISNGY